MPSLSNKSILFITTGIVLVVLIDTSITAVSSYTGGIDSSIISLFTFFVVVAVYSISQFIMLRYVKSKMNLIKRNRGMLYLHYVVFFTQFVLISIIVVVILQMLFFESYSAILLKGVVWINYILASIIFAIFGIRLLLWENLNRNHVLVLYALAGLALAATCIITILYVNNQLSGTRGIEYIFPIKNAQSIISGANNPYNTAYTISSAISFVLTWCATVFLLHHYSGRLGKTKYSILMGIPLLYFLSQFQPVIPEIFNSFRENDPILFGLIHTIFFNISKPVGGILFGLAFWSITKAVRKSVVKDYMAISAYGIMIFFTVHQPLLVTLIPYPPFGISTICFIGLSSYLVLVGFYSSALSIASDAQLYKAVRKSLPPMSNLLGNIGNAQEIQRVRTKAIMITNDLKDKISKETGITASVEEDDIKQYLNSVLDELHNRKENMQQGDKQ